MMQAFSQLMVRLVIPDLLLPNILLYLKACTLQFNRNELHWTRLHFAK